MKTYYIVSGGFDPIHEGHIEMIKASAESSDGVIVLVNSDEWLRRKKGKEFQSFKTRKTICENLKGVICALGFNDDDNSVDQLSKMIDIKEAFLSQCYNDFCLKCVNEMYLKIIEIYSIQNDDNFKPFLERMHKLFVKYDQKDKK